MRPVTRSTKGKETSGGSSTATIHEKEDGSKATVTETENSPVTDGAPTALEIADKTKDSTTNAQCMGKTIEPVDKSIASTTTTGTTIEPTGFTSSSSENTSKESSQEKSVTNSKSGDNQQNIERTQGQKESLEPVQVHVKPVLMVDKPRSSKSIASKASSNKQRRSLEAKVKLAEAEAALARTKYELACIDSDDSLSDSETEGRRIETRAQVERWVDKSVGERPEPIPEEPIGERRISMTSQAAREQEGDRNRINLPVSAPQPSTEMQLFTTTFVQAIREAVASASPVHAQQQPQQQEQQLAHTVAPKYISELLHFSGEPSEWIAFKATYRDSERFFSETQNVARIRKALQGKAREAIRSILYTSTDPVLIMDALEKRFGRPRRLIKSEIANLERMAPLADDARNLASFAGTVANTVTTIQQMNELAYLHSTDVSEKVIDKLSLIIKFKWYEYRSTHKDSPILLALNEFLSKLSDTYETYETDVLRAPSRKEYYRGRPLKKTVQVHRLDDSSSNESENEREDYSEEESSDDIEEGNDTVAIAQRQANLECLLCKEKHLLSKCKNFLEMKIDERWETVKKVQACFLCLSFKHRGYGCRKKLCGTDGCRGRHHKLLHRKREKESDKDKSASKAPVKEGQAMSVNTVSNTKAYLKIAPVEVFGPKGSVHLLALLDEGASISLLDSKVAKKIGAEGPEENLLLNGIGGHRLNETKSQALNIKIRGLYTREINMCNVYTLSHMKLPEQAVKEEDISDCPHLEDVKINLTYNHQKPKLLLGQDNIRLIYTREIRIGEPSKPVASRTKLGWILHGCKTKCRPDQIMRSVNHLYVAKTKDDELEQAVKNHFSIESLGVSPRKTRNDPEQRALTMLEKTTKRLPDGSFESGLLWQTDHETMPASRETALSRLYSLERKLKKNENLDKEYRKLIQNLLDNDYAEKVTTEPTSPRAWYLPHFAVTHPQKGKTRQVFDAANRVSTKCLNDALLSGPDLLQSLFGVLIRFREGPIAVMADIKEMFLRVKIREEDRDSLRFLWREKHDQKPQEYRMKSLIFGATSSPTTAIYVKNRNARDFKDKYPEAVKAIESNFYVDDYLQSFHSKEKAKDISQQVYEINKAGNFYLRGWASNDPSVIQRFSNDMNENTQVTIGSQHQEEKTLGLRWNLKSDTLNFTLSLRSTPREAILGIRKPTKREATSAVMTVFDPLGLASPILIQGKIMLQHIWRSGITWDEPLCDREGQEWLRWLHELDKLQDLNIPRCISTKNIEGQLHIFCDSSEKSYGTAVYWRTINPDGSVEIQLIAGKARVSPLKHLSIPRLELQATLLGCRLAHSIEKESNLRVTDKTYWTDSRTVLAWIKSDARTFKPFVAHRLAEIEDYTKPKQWRWVPSSQNVADDTTRGAPATFDANHRWFRGPEFLHGNPENWPKDTSEKPLQTTGEERRKQAALASTTPRKMALVHDERLSQPLPLTPEGSDILLAHTPVSSRTKQFEALPKPERFSSFTRLIKAYARTYQAVDIFKSKLKAKKNLQTINSIKKYSTKNKDATWRANQKRDKKLKKQSKTPCKNIPSQLGNKNYIPLSNKNLNQALNTLLKIIQIESFKNDISKLKNKQPLDKNSKLRRLTLQYSDDFIYLSTRISSAQYLPDTYKKPIILDGNHRITRLLIEQYHKDFNHGNHQTIINELRQKYYITSLRTTVKNIIRNCYQCKLNKSLPLTAPFGDLPPERLHRYKRPFTYLAVDYFGPMMVTVGRRHEKRWGALFTCLSTRAVHIELACSLSADSMILALRRLAARRGAPTVCMSDNATNFCLANKQLKEEIDKMNKNHIVEKAAEKGITWKFIPPGNPSAGGAWERLVRSIKVALTSTLNERYPKEEVLHTLLLEAEHIVNSRPLTEVSLDPDDTESLTPNHFLIGCSNGAPSIGDFDDTSLVGKSTWRIVQRLADHFWTRWTKEYLPTLQPRYLNGRAYINPSPGDIVLIVDSSLPRGTWPRGEIIKVHPGPDGNIRVVEIRTKNGILRRPTSRLVILTSTSLIPETSAVPEKLQ